MFMKIHTCLKGLKPLRIVLRMTRYHQTCEGKFLVDSHLVKSLALLALQALGTLWYFIAGRRGEPGLGGTVAGATPR